MKANARVYHPLQVQRPTRGGLDTVVDPRRWARICRTHRKPLADSDGVLQCPGDGGLGAHVATRWLVLDRQKGVVLNEATSEKDLELEVQEVRRPLAAACPDEADARAAYRAELDRATKSKWVVAPLSPRLEIKPVPAPPGA